MLKNFLSWNLGRATVIWNSLLLYTFIPLNASIVLGHGHQSERTFKNKLTFILNASLNSSNKSSTVRLFSARSFPGCFSSSSSLPSSLFFDSSKLCINKETWEPFPAGFFSAAMLTVSDVCMISRNWFASCMENLYYSCRIQQRTRFKGYGDSEDVTACWIGIFLPQTETGWHSGLLPLASRRFCWGECWG